MKRPPTPHGVPGSDLHSHNPARQRVLRIATLLLVLAAIRCGMADDAALEADGKNEAGAGGTSASNDAGGDGPDVATPDGEGGSGGSGAMAGSGGAAGMAGGPQSVAERALFVVHTSPDLYDFRLCVTADTAVIDELPMPYDPAYPVPYSNFTGVPVGGAADLSPLLPAIAGSAEYTLHVINASNAKVAGVYEGSPNETSCQDLICTGSSSCLSSAEVSSFGPFATDGFDSNPVQLLVVEGCLTGTGLPLALDQEKCGPTFNEASPVSNVTIRSVGISPFIPSSDLGVTVYAAHFAPTLGTTYNEKRLRLSIGPWDNAAEWVTLVDDLDDTPVASTLTPVPMPPEEDDYRNRALVLEAVDNDDAVQTILLASLSDILAFQHPDALATEFYSAASGYLFLVVGDATTDPAPWLLQPNGPNPDFDGRGLHILSLPMRESVR